MPHRTHEQDVVDAKAGISRMKNAYMNDIQAFIDTNSAGSTKTRCAILACQQSGTAYFNYAEEFVGNSDLLGAHRSAMWAQGFAEDCAEILRSLPAHVEFLRGAFKKADIGISDDTLVPGRTAFANMQRMVTRYLTPEVSNEIKAKLIESGLPVYGFQNEAREFMSKTMQTVLAFVFGVCFVATILTIALVKPNPTSYQFGVFKTVLALAGAGVAAVIPGFLEVRFREWLRAGGALAVFIVLYFFNPAGMIIPTPKTQASPSLPSAPKAQ
jgi:hypothetical protein